MQATPGLKITKFNRLGADMEKVSSSLAGLAENPEKRLKFGISPRQKFENANLLAEHFPLFPCLARWPELGTA